MACLLESGLGLPERLVEIRLVMPRSTLPNGDSRDNFGQLGVSIANNEKARKPLAILGFAVIG